MARESVRTIAARRLLGIAYIGVLVGLISLSIAVYNKAFSSEVLVTLKTDHTGNQLQTQGDVKERGIIVGTIKKVKSTGDGATVTLALDPSRISEIPANVKAQILPKTIFGEQYVSLIYPNQPDATSIKAHDSIEQDRSGQALETEKVLGDLLPLLQAVKPAELFSTLNALSTALQGRGATLGQSLVTLDTYLKAINPSVPKMVDDINKLGQVAAEYNDAAPDILQTLDNLETSAQTLIAKQDAFSTVLQTANSASQVFTGFLSDNRSRLISIVQTSHQIYPLLAEYSPSLDCVFNALVTLNDLASSAIVNHQIQLSAQLYIPPPGLGQYSSSNSPSYITGFGPNCMGLPNPQIPFKIPGNYRCVNDGAALTTDPCSQHPSSKSVLDQQSVGSQAESAVVATLISGSEHLAPDQVPPIATVLAAPALRGAEVQVK